jgi:hypothetical protein
MSFADRLVLWLHIAFAIFTIGPITLAISSTPRYIRKRDVPTLRYLSRITVLFSVLCLGVLIAGLVLADLDKDFSHPWVTASLTLFVVALVLLVLIIRDQRRAIKVLDVAAAEAAAGPGSGTAGESGDAEHAAAGGADTRTAVATEAEHIAGVQRGRIVAMGGMVNLIWLVILVLMVWNG